MTFEEMKMKYDADTILTIPENPTNGDIIKALFPNCPCTPFIHEYGMYEDKSRQNLITTFPSGWWNAPYKKEGE